MNTENATKKPSKRAVAKLLRGGASRIEKFGWRKGTFGNEHTGFCALGSIKYGKSAESDVAARAMRQVLRSEGLADYVATFNDSVANDKSEVTALMRRTARALEHGLVVK